MFSKLLAENEFVSPPKGARPKGSTGGISGDGICPEELLVNGAGLLEVSTFAFVPGLAMGAALTGAAIELVRERGTGQMKLWFVDCDSKRKGGGPSLVRYASEAQATKVQQHANQATSLLIATQKDAVVRGDA